MKMYMNTDDHRNPEDILGLFNKVKRSGDGWSALCPHHDDHSSSLSLKETDGMWLIHCFVGCTFDEIVQSLGVSKSIFFKSHKGSSSNSLMKFHATTQPPVGCSVEEYAKAKQLKVELLKVWQIKDVNVSGKKVMRIPYFDEDVQEVSIRYRVQLHKDNTGDNRFRWKKGSKAYPYGVWFIYKAEQQGFIIIVEGESDCHTLWQNGLPALGLPGANTWKNEWEEKLSNIPAIYVVVEPDQGGAAVLKKFAQSPLRERIRLVHLRDAKDVSELHCKLQGKMEFNTHMQLALKEAKPWKDFQEAEKQHYKNLAWAKCKTLAQKTDILGEFETSLKASGFAGEVDTAKLLYLIVVSRVLNQIVSAVVKAPSSAGKSFLVKSVLQYFPDDAYYTLSSMSERALAYDDTPLSHRILVVAEAAGMAGDFASYLLRTLLSEGRIHHITVEKTDDGTKPLHIEREGPTGLIVTTTSVFLHAENETRLLSLSVSDSAEQTRKVLLAIASETTSKPDFTEWHMLQTWISNSQNSVTIPFGTALATLLPTSSIRLRRDFASLLSLIKAHAVLHQVNREQTPDNRIIATYDDYAAVRELVKAVLSEGVELSVPKRIRKTVDCVAHMQKNDVYVSGINYAAIGRVLKIDKSTAKRRVEVAIERGYLKNLEPEGKPASIVVADALPKDHDILPTVDEVIAGCKVAPKKERATELSEFPDYPMYGKTHICVFTEIKSEKGTIERCELCGGFRPLKGGDKYDDDF